MQCKMSLHLICNYISYKEDFLTKIMYGSGLLTKLMSSGLCRYSFCFQSHKSYYFYGLVCPFITKSQCYTLIFLILIGITASGLFSQSLITNRIKPHTICRAKTSPDLSQSVCDNVKDLINESYSDTSNNHQEKIKIRETNNQLISYSGDKSYSQSQVMTVIERGILHAFTVAVALSVHSVFEGLAFGLQDSINDVCM